MNQSGLLERIKGEALCLSGLTLNLLLLLWAIWNDWGIIMLTLTLSALAYLLYQTIATNAYQVLTQTIRRHKKFNKLHEFMESKTSKEGNLNTLRGFNQRTFSEEKRRLREPSGNKKVGEGSLKKGKGLKLFINKQKQITAKKRHQLPEISFENVLKAEDFNAARQGYKQTLKILEKGGVKVEQIKEVSTWIKQDYYRKVEQLLCLSEENQQNIISILQQNYEVKVMLGEQSLPEKVEPVTFDEVIDRLKLLHFTRSLPWTKRGIKENFNLKILQGLDQLMNTRDKIDSFLAPHKVLHQKDRQQLVVSLKQQIKGEKVYRHDLVRMLVKIFNENIKVPEYLLQFPGLSETKEGLFVQQSFMGERIHIDLRYVREKAKGCLRIQPGEDNLWYTFAVAAQIYKYRLSLEEKP